MLIFLLENAGFYPTVLENILELILRLGTAHYLSRVQGRKYLQKVL